LDLIVVASHYEPQAVGAVLENKADAQTDPQLKPGCGEFADAQPLMPVRMAEIPLQNLQGPADFATRFPGIPSHRGTKDPA
jgi:hypothetical protein